MKRLLAFILALCAASPVVASWTVDGQTYNHRKQITVQNAYIDSDLSAFPVYIPIIGDTDIKANTNADGSDIRFTSSDGSTVIPYEREYYQVGSSSVTARFWVKSDLTAASGGTVYIYYRSAATSDGNNPTNVWDSNYTHIWHLNDSTSPVVDTLGVTNLSQSNSPSFAQTGVVGKAVTFASASKQTVYTTTLDANAKSTWVTAEGWFYATSDGVSNTREIIQFVLPSPWFAQWNLSWENSSSNNHLFSRLGFTDSTMQDRLSGVVSKNAWHHGAVTWDGTYMRLYVDGVQADFANVGAKTLQYTNSTFSVGGSYGDATSTNYFDGTADEVRLSKTNRSASWIKFEYRNIAEADNELTWGAEETPAGGAPLKTLMGVGQ